MTVARRLALWALAVALAVGAPQAQGRGKPVSKHSARPRAGVGTPHSATEAATSLQASPDGALRAFLASIISRDLTTLRQVILPVSEDDWRYLVPARPLPAGAREAIGAQIGQMPIHSLQPGETVALAGGRSFRVGRGDVGPDHVLLQTQEKQVPVLVVRIKGLWYVDPTSIIAARKATEKMEQDLAKKSGAADKGQGRH
jgi:hypothetical protein